jgi:predicted NAD/FAD-binding protein
LRRQLGLEAMSAQREREKVAVLGGGPAAMAAAFELSATPKLCERFEVTVYQPGGRLGGKCASGRNDACYQRIEEQRGCISGSASTTTRSS